MKKIISIFFLFIILASCKDNSTDNGDNKLDFNPPDYSFTSDSLPPPPDYASDYYWMALPDNAASPEKKVDVFWLYLTVFVSEELWNMPIDIELNRQQAQITIPWQAAVFSEDCNIYAPFYRQTCFGAFFADKNDFDSSIAVAVADSKAALLYYLKNYNNGRPFIFAGHSQGSLIIKELMKDPDIVPYLNQLISAYMLGFNITPEELQEFPQLAPAESETETGKIILYNTVENGYQDKSITLNRESPSVNPLSWKTTGEKADASLHLGARVIMFQDDGSYIFDTIPKFTSAQIIDGGLCIERPAIASELNLNLAGLGVYHIYDYDFFYFNIKENLKKRIAAFK
jgi:Protein of unknown function (DUF3089)